MVPHGNESAPPSIHVHPLASTGHGALLILVGLLTWFALGSTSARAEGSSLAPRSEVIMGESVPASEAYDVSSKPLETNALTRAPRIPGIPVRQHPVNVELFDTGCSQCHRLSGPLPPGTNAPQDVFDQLQAQRATTEVPAHFTRLTLQDTRQEYPSWSPDGKRILFESVDGQGRYNLWLMNPDGTHQRRLTDHAAAGWATWHPDANRVVYWASDGTGTSNLWLHDIDTGLNEQVTHHAMTAWPQWHPEGRWLAFQARNDTGWSLRILDMETGHEIDLARPDDSIPSRPLWSPDGSQILYQSLKSTGFELVRLAFPHDDSGEPEYDAAPSRTVTPTELPIDLGAATQHPSWNPTSGRIAFLMYAIDVAPPGTLVYSYKTWTATPDGTDRRLLVRDDTLADRSPSWNAQGTWLAQWSWDVDLRAGIWLVNESATQRIELTAPLGGDSLYPAWSPDGTRVAFSNNREGSFDIWVADVHSLTAAPPREDAP